MTTNNWTQFRKEVFIRTDPQTLFRSWLLPSELTRWFIAEATYTDINGDQRGDFEPIEAGDQYHWRWHQDLETSGEILEVVPDKRLVFTFGRVAAEEGLIQVEVDIEAVDDEVSRFTLTQATMPNNPQGQQFYLSCNLGWSFFMTNLKALVEHGVDLRESDQMLAERSRAISTMAFDPI